MIYGELRRVLERENQQEQIGHFIDDTVQAYVHGATEGFAEEWDLEKLWANLKRLYPVSLTIEEVEEEFGDRSDLDTEQLVELLRADAQAAYTLREEKLGEEVMRELERRVILSVLDRRWREHLYEMDYLQEGIGLRAMAQRDPLVEYQREGFDMFNAMMEGIKEESVGYLFNVEVEIEQVPEAPSISMDKATPLPEIHAKGLAAPQRPSHLKYSAPTIDGEGGVVTVEEDFDEDGAEADEGATRAERRRAQRDGRELPTVRVVRIRHAENRPSVDDETSVRYRVRWTVRGHWRRQWYPSRGDHRPVWINPHVKGPDGAPLHAGETVHLLDGRSDRDQTGSP